MATPNYNVDLENNPELKAVRTEEQAAIDKNAATYDSMIEQTDQFFDKQIEASKDWADKQTQIQNEQTDFTIEQIEQQKEQAHKDYTKEQSGSYVDWKKQSNQYGVNAEQKAAGGMQNTGYAESSQVAMYNQYQQRVVAARETYQRAVLNYDNAMKDARLQNNAALAKIAFESLQKQLELSLQGFQYKNQLISEKADREMQIKSLYQNKWATVLDQINTENELAEKVRQFGITSALQERAIALDEAQFAWQKEQAASGGGNGRIQKSSSKSSSTGKGGIKKNAGDNETVNITQKESNSGGKGNSGPTIDMNSVLSLGYGPISASRLSELVSQGSVKKYVEGNKIKFRRNTGFVSSTNKPALRSNYK